MVFEIVKTLERCCIPIKKTILLLLYLLVELEVYFYQYFNLFLNHSLAREYTSFLTI
jgi:hypothetical protein